VRNVYCIKTVHAHTHIHTCIIYYGIIYAFIVFQIDGVVSETRTIAVYNSVPEYILYNNTVTVAAENWCCYRMNNNNYYLHLPVWCIHGK